MTQYIALPDYLYFVDIQLVAGIYVALTSKHRD